VRPVLKALTTRLGRYFSRSAAARIRSRVTADTSGDPRRPRDTVIIDTPSSVAIWRRLGRLRCSTFRALCRSVQIHHRLPYGSPFRTSRPLPRPSIVNDNVFRDTRSSVRVSNTERSAPRRVSRGIWSVVIRQVRKLADQGGDRLVNRHVAQIRRVFMRSFWQRLLSVIAFFALGGAHQASVAAAEPGPVPLPPTAGDHYGDVVAGRVSRAPAKRPLATVHPDWTVWLRARHRGDARAARRASLYEQLREPRSRHDNAAITALPAADLGLFIRSRRQQPTGVLPGRRGTARLARGSLSRADGCNGLT
jgi:hypothetical protein